jgi:hypothetical protein
LAKGEEGAKSSPKEDNVVAVIDGFRERVLVCVKTAEHAFQQCILVCLLDLECAVEIEEFGE